MGRSTNGTPALGGRRKRTTTSSSSLVILQTQSQPRPHETQTSLSSRVCVWHAWDFGLNRQHPYPCVPKRTCKGYIFTFFPFILFLCLGIKSWISCYTNIENAGNKKGEKGCSLLSRLWMFSCILYFCVWFAFYCCDKTPPSNANVWGLFSLHFQTTVHPSSRGAKAEAGTGHWLVPQGLLPMACTPRLFIHPRMACPDVAPPTVAWIFPHQSLIKKNVS